MICVEIGSNLCEELKHENASTSDVSRTFINY